jgi:hypothetical protein
MAESEYLDFDMMHKSFMHRPSSGLCKAKIIARGLQTKRSRIAIVSKLVIMTHQHSWTLGIQAWSGTCIPNKGSYKQKSIGD